jgi:LysM repeat protein
LLTACLSRSSQTRGGDIDEFVPPVQPAVAQTEATIQIQPVTQQLVIGQTTSVEVRVDNVIDLVGLEFELSFTPAILQVQDADPGRDGIQLQPNETFLSGFIATNDANNATGLIRYAVSQLGPFTPVSGGGGLAIITFQAVAQGVSQITFRSARLVRSDFQLIPVLFQPGQIDVVAPPGQPTNTLTPTVTPTSAQATLTPTPTAPVIEPTATATSILETPTATPTSTPPTATPTNTPIPTSTPTPLPGPTNTPIPIVTKPPPGATVGFCYRVREGETLYKIGQKFGVNPYYLNLVNDLYPPGYIVTHQIIFIPKQRGHGPNVYIVKPGDTLATIADQCRLTVSFLAWVNHLDEDVTLQPGHVLIIPIPPFPPPGRFVYPWPDDMLPVPNYK